MFTSVLLGLAMISPALQEPPKAAPKAEMKTFQFVFLRPGVEKPGESGESNQKRQMEHLANLERWWLKEGKAVFLGPVMGSPEIRGIIVFKTSAEEAKALVAEDPYVKSGQMTADIRPLMADDGILRKPPKFLDLGPYTLGFFKRASSTLPKLSDEQGKTLMAGHLGNLTKMWEAGALVWAGPFLDNTDVRGLLIFRETDQDKIKAMVSVDPLVKAGRLVLELHRGIAPKGAFPPFEKAGG